MSLGDAVTATYKSYADFLGKASRSEYWLFVLYVAIVTTIATLLAIGIAIFGSVGAILLGADLGAEAAADGLSASLIFLFILLGAYTLWALATLIPWISSTVRRVRDTGLSGLFVLVILIPGIGNIILFVLTLLPTKNSDSAVTNQDQSYPTASAQEDLW